MSDERLGEAESAALLRPDLVAYEIALGRIRRAIEGVVFRTVSGVPVNACN